MDVLILGYDHTEKKVRIGPLAENTHPEIRDKIEEMLTESHDMTPKDAKEVVDHTWKDTPDDMKIKCTANLPELFSRLKKQGVKVRPFESQLLCLHGRIFQILYMPTKFGAFSKM